MYIKFTFEFVCVTCVVHLNNKGDHAFLFWYSGSLFTKAILLWTFYYTVESLSDYLSMFYVALEFGVQSKSIHKSTFNKATCNLSHT